MRTEYYEEQFQALKSVTQETTSQLGAHVSLKFTPTEKHKRSDVQPQYLPEGEDPVPSRTSPENINTSPGSGNTLSRSIKGSIGFSYSKNESYHLLLSYSSTTVRTLYIDNIMGYKLTKTPLPNLSV